MGLGTRTWGGRIEGTNESIELWWCGTPELGTYFGQEVLGGA